MIAPCSTSRIRLAHPTSIALVFTALLFTRTSLLAEDAAARFTTPDDLALDLVLSEPLVRQPVFINFDERGRLWVVQYLQYPAPRG